MDLRAGQRRRARAAARARRAVRGALLGARGGPVRHQLGPADRHHGRGNQRCAGAGADRPAERGGRRRAELLCRGVRSGRPGARPELQPAGCAAGRFHRRGQRAVQLDAARAAGRRAQLHRARHRRERRGRRTAGGRHSAGRCQARR